MQCSARCTLLQLDGGVSALQGARKLRASPRQRLAGSRTVTDWAAGPVTCSRGRGLSGACACVIRVVVEAAKRKRVPQVKRGTWCLCNATTSGVVEARCIRWLIRDGSHLTFCV